MFVYLVTANAKERFLDLFGRRYIDVLSPIPSFNFRPLQFLSCQVQLCFFPFMHVHDFFQWYNAVIIAEVKELWRGALNIINLSRHEKVHLMRLCFERYWQRRWLCHKYLKKKFGPERKQSDLWTWVRRICAMQLFRMIRH